MAEYVHLDLAGPLPETEDRHKCILCIQCNFRGYCVAIPIKNKEHETVMKGFLDHWVYRFGPPAVLISDNEWTSQAFEVLCQSFQVEHRLNPVLQSQEQRPDREDLRDTQTIAQGSDQRAEPESLGKLAVTHYIQPQHHCVQN